MLIVHQFYTTSKTLVTPKQKPRSGFSHKIQGDRFGFKLKKKIQRMIVNDDSAIGVIGLVIANPRLSSRGLSATAGISHMTAWRILKNHKFHSYKIQLVYELNEDDFDRRQEFVEGMSERLFQNPELLYNICFSDECSFYLNVCESRHNCRYWSDENSRQYAAIHTQYPQKVNVWARILSNHIMGPFFIEGNLTGDSYLKLLEETIQPRTVEIIEQDPRRYTTPVCPVV